MCFTANARLSLVIVTLYLKHSLFNLLSRRSECSVLQRHKVLIYSERTVIVDCPNVVSGVSILSIVGPKHCVKI